MYSIELPESDYLYIKKSKIKKAGQGLFTAIDIFEGEIISYYKGEVLTKTQIKKRVKSNRDQYFITLLNGDILDSLKVDCFAKYANDVKGSSKRKIKNNAKIASKDDLQVCLLAKRNINQGEEIYCGYGKEYWKKHGK